MVQTSKELVRGLFEGKNSIVPFIPWVCSFAARLEQVTVKNMLSDAGVLSRSLINAQKLFGYDAIVNIFDPTLEAEACGCEVKWFDENSLPTITNHPLGEGKSIWGLNTSDIEKKGRIPEVLEATKRLTIIKGKDVAIGAIITGPLSLARYLRGDAFLDKIKQGDEEAEELVEETGSICLRLCRAYCELGIDFIVITEEILGKLEPEYFQVIASPLQSIWNVVGYYNVHSIILGKGCSEKHVESVFDLGADGVALSGDIDYHQMKEKAFEKNRCFGIIIPDSKFTQPDVQPENEDYKFEQSVKKGLFLSTEWELPYTTDVNNMHRIMRDIREYQCS